MNEKVKAPSITVFYDASCPLCSNFISRLPEAFDTQDSSQGPAELRGSIRVVTHDQELRGVEALCAIWQSCGTHPLLRAALLNPLIKPLADLGYALFASQRGRLSAALVSLGILNASRNDR